MFTDACYVTSCLLLHYFRPSGEDGPSQMALEDIAMFRAIPTCTLFYPSDGVSTERSVELAANTKVRTSFSPGDGRVGWAV